MESMDGSKKCSDHGGNAAEPAFFIHLLPGPPQNKKNQLQSSVPLVSFLEVAVVVFTILVPSPVVLALQIARLRISTEFEQE